MIVNNKVEANQSSLTAIYKVVTKTVDAVISQNNDGLLIKPKNIAELESFTTDVRTILTDKIRKKFGL